MRQLFAAVVVGVLAWHGTATSAQEAKGAKAPAAGQTSHANRPLRVGVIGLDTSHCTAFTKILHDPKNTGDLANIRVVAAFPGGSPDMPFSVEQTPKLTADMRGLGVEIVDSIPALLAKVDVVLVESVDGRPHLEQVRPVFAAGKPVYIDKPLGGTLVDSIAIAELGERTRTPWFSSSSLRFGPGVATVKGDPKLGDVVGCVAWSPCHLDPTHPDLYWYGVHGCELLYTYMGPGCKTVTRSQTQSVDVVTGVWQDGRIGTFRGLRKPGKQDYGAVVFGTKGILPAPGFEGYKPLVEQIATFFRTGMPPVQAAETIELMAFMEAADESKRQGGKPVGVQDVLDRARAEAKKKVGG